MIKRSIVAYMLLASLALGQTDIDLGSIADLTWQGSGTEFVSVFGGGAPAPVEWTDPQSYAGFLIEMEETNATQYLDTSAETSGANAMSNMPSWASGGVYTIVGTNENGRVEHGVTLNGTSAYLKTDATDILNGATSMTMTVWAYKTADMLSYAGLLFYRGTRVVGLQANSTDEIIRFALQDNAGNSGSVIPTNELPQDVWTHYAVRWAAGTATEMYINGVLAATGNTAPNALQIDDSWKIGIDDLSGRYFQGIVDQVTLDNTYWSSNAIYTQFLNTSPTNNIRKRD